MDARRAEPLVVGGHDHVAVADQLGETGDPVDAAVGVGRVRARCDDTDGAVRLRRPPANRPPVVSRGVRGHDASLLSSSCSSAATSSNVPQNGIACSVAAPAAAAVPLSRPAALRSNMITISMARRCASGNGGTLGEHPGRRGTVRGVGHVLQGIRVVDVTSGPVGGMTTMVLGDFGADVVKVEPPGGDRFRAEAASPLWLRGKRSVTADLGTAAGRDVLHELVRAADVLVVSGPPERAARWGIDTSAGTALNPKLVHCSITGWGPAGPLAGVPGYEAAVAARSGRMLAFERQLRRGGPVFTAVPVAGHVAAHGAVQGILAALVARSRGAGAEVVSTSLLQGLLPFDLVELLLVEMAVRSGVEAPNLLTAGGDMPTLNYHPVRAKDGRWLQLGNLLEHLLYAFLDATEVLGELLLDERFMGPPATWSPEAVEFARDAILVRLQERTADEWMDVFRANGNVAAEPYLTTTEALHHPDIVAAGDVVTYDDPVRGAVRTIGPVAELTETPAEIGTPAPQPGEHTATVPAEWAAPRADPLPAAPGSTPPPAGRPLDGITVVEFATIIAAPTATLMLADLGAHVIKIEPIDGDPYRHLVAGGTPAAKTTAGKTSICIDLKKPDGRQIAAELIAGADVVVHNWRPGVADRLGLGEAEMRAANPGLIWVSVTGYGRHSPSTARPATHPCAGAASGGAGRQAGAALDAACDTLEEVREISRQLMRANESNPDPNTGVVAAGAALAGAAGP